VPGNSGGHARGELTTESGRRRFSRLLSVHNTKEKNVRVRRALFAAAVLGCYTSLLMAEDAVKVDPKHYTVVTENAQVRVLRVHYGPHEKSVMHSHPATVAVFLTPGSGRFTSPDGKTQDFTFKSGDTQYSAATTHLPENTGDQAFELIVVELKGKTAKSAKAANPK
jgi:beta-alanine degradation protein BauB